jgi:hypothetical protein
MAGTRLAISALLHCAGEVCACALVQAPQELCLTSLILGAVGINPFILIRSNFETLSKLGTWSHPFNNVEREKEGRDSGRSCQMEPKAACRKATHPATNQGLSAYD